MRDSVIVTNKARLALGTLVALSLAFAIFCSRQNTATTSFADENSVSTNSLPADILQLFQREANSPPWNEDSPTKTQAILQQCATLQQLITSNAPDDTLSNALAASTLRVSVFMTFGQTLSATEDTTRVRERIHELVKAEADDRIKIWARVSLGGERSIDVARECGYGDGSGVRQLIRRLETAAHTHRPLRHRLEQLRELSRIKR